MPPELGAANYSAYALWGVFMFLLFLLGELTNAQ